MPSKASDVYAARTSAPHYSHSRPRSCKQHTTASCWSILLRPRVIPTSAASPPPRWPANPQPLPGSQDADSTAGGLDTDRSTSSDVDADSDRRRRGWGRRRDIDTALNHQRLRIEQPTGRDRRQAQSQLSETAGSYGDGIPCVGSGMRGRFRPCRNRVVPYSCTPIPVRETIGPARVVLARPLKLGATEDSTFQPNRLGA
jgi:hypothetical protein